MIKPVIHLAIVGLLACIANSASASQDDIYAALKAGKADLNVRLRHEHVSEENMIEDADALTLRTRLGYTTAEVFRTTIHIDINDVRALIDDYAPEKTGYSSIADQVVTELNQAYFSIQASEGLEIKTGRQRLKIDNGRFIGNADWRQNEQTFDALMLTYEIEKFLLTAGYIKQVNAVIEKLAASDANNIVLNASYQIAEGATLGAYHYGIDQNTGAGINLDTTGLRLMGESLGDINYTYVIEYATQKNSLNESLAEYMLLELGVELSAARVLVGYEVLGSDDGLYGFQTPLASKHGFNGWADIWGETPDSGLEDLHIKVMSQAWGIDFTAAYHDYTANDSSHDLGSEINLLAVKPFADKYALGFKYASYSAADRIKVDTDKVWLWLEMQL